MALRDFKLDCNLNFLKSPHFNTSIGREQHQLCFAFSVS